MLRDDPSEEDVKLALDDIEQCTLLAKSAWEARQSADAGFVTWCQTPPAGIGYQTHKFSLLDAFATAFAFCRTRCRHETLMVGQAIFAVLRTLPQFAQDPAIDCPRCPLVYVGRLGQIIVYLIPDQHPQEFCAGVPGSACRGVIAEPNAHYADFGEPHGRVHEAPADPDGGRQAEGAVAG